MAQLSEEELRDKFEEIIHNARLEDNGVFCGKYVTQAVKLARQYAEEREANRNQDAARDIASEVTAYLELHQDNQSVIYEIVLARLTSPLPNTEKEE